MVNCGLVVLAIMLSLSSAHFVYAETIIGEQTTLSGDLQNNPIAQDILEKIGKSKRWIDKLQQKNFETIEKQKELEAKRAEVLQYLENDLKKWEELWGVYTFDSMLERALENSPAKDTDSIYDHPLKFTASKISAGRIALQNALEQGGTPEEARDAFVNAAKITRAEMLSANSIYNILNNDAYYNQQILFNTDGNFDLTLSGEQLRKYYQDYRTNPEYLKANPFDKLSWEDLGKNNPETECRIGFVLVYRINVDDYVCTTEYTAEMWVRHNMGTIVDEAFSEIKFIDVEKLQHDRILKKVNNLNSKIHTIHEHHEKKLVETKQDYETLFVKTNEKRTLEEKQAIAKYGKSDSKKIVLSKEITDIREKYDALKEDLSDEKSRILKIMNKQYLKDMDDFASNYEHDSEMNLFWNSKVPVFEISLNE